MKFKFGQLFLSLVILVGVFGFGGESKAVDCDLSEAFCKNTTGCVWNGAVCQKKEVIVDCTSFKYVWSCNANSASNCTWGGPLTRCYNKNSGIPGATGEMTGSNETLGKNPAQKVLVIGNKNFYNGCNEDYGFVKLLNQQLNPDYIFECKSDSVFNFPYDSKENFMKYSFSNFTTALNKYKDGSFGYDHILLLMNSENLVYEYKDTGSSSGYDQINFWEEEKQNVLNFVNLVKSLNLGVNMIFNPLFKDFNIARTANNSKVVSWSDGWQDRVLSQKDYIISVGGGKFNVFDIRNKLGSTGDFQKLNPIYDNGDHYTWNSAGHQKIAEFIVDEVYEEIYKKPKTIEFCLCTSNNSSCETKKYNTKTICESDIKILQARGNNEKLQCVQVESGKACDSLVSATSNGEDKSGVTNSDLLNDLKPRISALNKLTVKDVPALIGKIISTILGILGSIALVMIMYGGLLWMTARGNSEKTQKAIQVLIWSTLGIAIIFASYSIVNLVFDTFR